MRFETITKQQPVLTEIGVPSVVPARSILDWVPECDSTGNTPTILIVDGVDINRRVLKAMLKAAPYRLLEASRASQALALIEQESIDLIIIDLVMPEVSGAELCRRIKSDRRTQFIPILMLTNVPGIENEIDSIASGADEFLTKPLHPEVVRTRIKALLRNKAAVDSLEEAETILFALAQSVEGRDPYTSGHCQRLAAYAVRLGKALGLPDYQITALYRGGFLHDIGKVCIPDAILFKQGRLNEDEWEIMRSHTIRGEEICRPMKTLSLVLPIIRNHHERWDGTGYPDGLKGERIPLLARILQIVDIYDALTTVRPYKAAYSPEEAFRTLEEEARRGWRDIELLSLFREIKPGYATVPEPPPAAPCAVNTPAAMTMSLENMRREVSR